MSRKRKTKVYLAGPWFTPDAKMIHRVAKSIMKEQSMIEPMFPDEMSVGCTPAQTFHNNVEAIKNCDIVVALVDVKDVGTAWEIGMAYKLKKKIVLVGADYETFTSKTNLMLAYSGDCLLIQDLEEFLTNYKEFNKYVIHVRSWEVIE